MYEAASRASRSASAWAAACASACVCASAATFAAGRLLAYLLRRRLACGLLRGGLGRHVTLGLRDGLAAGRRPGR